MPVNLDQYRGAVGAFNSRLHSKNIYINISIRMLDVLPVASAFVYTSNFYHIPFVFLKFLFYHFTQEEYQNHEHIIT